MEFQDKRVLISGSTRGIGFSLAEHFIAEGAVVAINGRRQESVAEAITKLDAEKAVDAHGDLSTPYN